MRRRFLDVLILMILAVCMVTSCGRTDETGSVTEVAVSEVAEEVVQFVNRDLPSISSGRNEAVEIYNSYFKDDSGPGSEEWLSQLEDTALPEFDEYLSSLEALSYNTSEVQNLHSNYLMSAELQRGAIQDVVDGIKNADSSYFDAAESKIEQSKTYLGNYEDNLRKICTNEGIEIR